MKLMIVDSHELIRDGLLLVLREAYLIDSYEYASDIYEAIKKTENYEADLILLDLLLPEELIGIASIEKLRKLLPKSKIVIFSLLNVISFKKKAFESGADGFLSSNLKKEEFIQSLDQIVASKKVFGNCILEQDVESENLEIFDLPITDREQEVFTMIVKGFPHKDIAERLDISIKTVENYRCKIGEKLNTHNRYEWLKIALQHNILPCRKYSADSPAAGFPY